ncbi:MAG: poly(A) polymerase [Luteibaculaceae bacterium]|jgi:poly(A) polymerase
MATSPSSENNQLQAAVNKEPFLSISKVADKMGLPCFTIGGFVRDLLLNRPSKDIDIVVVGSGIDFAQACAEELKVKKVNYFKRFGTAMFRYRDLELEFVGARKESYREDSRKPLVEDGSLEDDQNRRDFTINALAISLNQATFGSILDSFDGLKHLEEKILKTPLSPDITYSDDPLRMMRAIRFASQLDFTIEQESLDAITRNADRLKIISQERITTELNKIILSKKPSKGFKLLFNTGLLAIFFPEMVALFGVKERNGIRHKDNFYHTLQVLDNLSEWTDDLWLRWSAILHDIAKPPTQRFHAKAGWTFHGHEDRGARMTPGIFKRLKLPLDHKMKYVQKLVQLHLRPIALTKDGVTDSAIRRLVFDTGDDIDDLMLLCKADITSKNEMKVDRFRKNYELVKQKIVEIEEKDHLRNFQPPVSGEEIMERFKLKPCRAIGDLKTALKEAILEGEIPNEKEAAEALLEKIAPDIISKYPAQ